MDDKTTDPRMPTRNLAGWRLSVYWLVVAAWKLERVPSVLGRPGWRLTIRQPNGGWATIPARTRLGAWRKLLANPISAGYWL